MSNFTKFSILGMCPKNPLKSTKQLAHPRDIIPVAVLRLILNAKIIVNRQRYRSELETVFYANNMPNSGLNPIQKKSCYKSSNSVHECSFSHCTQGEQCRKKVPKQLDLGTGEGVSISGIYVLPAGLYAAAGMMNRCESACSIQKPLTFRLQ